MFFGGQLIQIDLVHIAILTASRFLDKGVPGQNREAPVRLSLLGCQPLGMVSESASALLVNHTGLVSATIDARRRRWMRRTSTRAKRLFRVSRGGAWFWMALAVIGGCRPTVLGGVDCLVF